MKRPSKLGLASAYIDGIKYSIELGFDTFIQMDADFSHNPKYLPEMIEKLKNYDLVITFCQRNKQQSEYYLSEFASPYDIIRLKRRIEMLKKEKN